MFFPRIKISPFYFWGILIGIFLILSGLGLNYWLAGKKNAEEATLSLKISDDIKKIPIGVSHKKVPNHVLGIDLVRLNASGDAAIAGHAPIGAKVTLSLNSITIGAVLADDKGEWVFLSESSLSSGEYRLALNAELKDQRNIYGNSSTLLIVPKEEDLQAAKQPIVLFLSPDETSSSRLLNYQFEADKTPLGPHFTIDTIDYGDHGEFILGGSIQSDQATLIVYLNNRPLARSKVSGKGATPVSWQIKADPPPQYGQYSLRIDMLDKDKVVLRRIVPFEWVNRSLLSSEKEYFTVQPGNNLWHIARRVLGKGARYTVLYDANRRQIKDPNLIHPGQIFIIPKDKKENTQP